MTSILLATNSPRRRELIQLTGWNIEMTTSGINEDPKSGESPRDHVVRLARDKALKVLSISKDRNILTADTIVVDNGLIYGKPQDVKDAIRILRVLRGHSHLVMTAIALYYKNSGKLLVDLCESWVPMRNYSDDEILEYVKSKDPMDKAGAYAIQNPGFHPVEDFTGCFASVMGMPLCHLERSARKVNISVSPGLQDRCQKFLRYQCNIYGAILRGDIIP